MDMNDKIAVVTGAARGIGLALTKGLLEKGAKVCMCDINESLGDKECQELSRKYGDDHVVFTGCDVREEDQFKERLYYRDTAGCGRFTRTGNGDRGGIVVNLCSNAGYTPVWFLPVYTATKHGVLGLTRSYAANARVRDEGVRVACLCPAPVKTDIVPDDIKRLAGDLFNDDDIMSTDVVIQALFKLLSDSDGCALKVDEGNPKEHLQYL